LATLPTDSSWPLEELTHPSTGSEPCRLPPLPLEDVYLHVKTIDNSRLESGRSGNALAAYGHALGAALLALGMLIVILMPHALNRVVERRLLVVQTQHQALHQEKLRVEAEEAAQLSQARQAEWAESRRLLHPAPGQVLALTPLRNPSVEASARSARSGDSQRPAPAAR